MESELNVATTNTNIYDIKIMLDVKWEPLVINVVDEDGEGTMDHDIFETGRNQDDRTLLSGTDNHFCKYRSQLTELQSEIKLLNTKFVTTKAQLTENAERKEPPQRILFSSASVTGTKLYQDESKGPLNKSGIFSVDDSSHFEAKCSSYGPTMESIPESLTPLLSTCEDGGNIGIPLFGSAFSSKGFKCSQCCKVYTQKQSLADHEKVHQNEDAFRCRQCSKKFQLHTCLAKHMNIHTKRFQCTICQMCSQSKAALECHLRTHTKEKPFECQYCGKLLATKFSLVNHMKKLHGKTFT